MKTLFTPYPHSRFGCFSLQASIFQDVTTEAFFFSTFPRAQRFQNKHKRVIQKDVYYAEF